MIGIDCNKGRGRIKFSERTKIFVLLNTKEGALKDIKLKKSFYLFLQIFKCLPLRPEISLDVTKMEVLKSVLYFYFPIDNGALAE